MKTIAEYLEAIDKAIALFESIAELTTFTERDDEIVAQLKRVRALLSPLFGAESEPLEEVNESEAQAIADAIKAACSDPS